MSTNEATGRAFEFIGGELCLDFANTLGGLRGGMTREYLRGYEDLVAWSQKVGIIAEDTAFALLHEAQQRPSEAGAALEKACAFRETIYRLFGAVATGSLPTADDLAALNAELGKAMAGGRVVPIADSFGWEWPMDHDALDQMLGPIARSSAELLTSPESGFVRECTSATCSWLFVDRTKNHRRRWCTMSGCGNQAKARRHRQRQRVKEAANPA